MSNLPTSFCIDIVAEKEHKRLREFKDWFLKECQSDSKLWHLRFYGKIDLLNTAYDVSFGELLTLDRFFSLLDPKPYTISDLSNGVCAVENDGSIGGLRDVLKNAFLEDSAISDGRHKFFFKNPTHNQWNCANTTDLPTQSVKLFLAELEGKEEFVLPEKWAVEMNHQEFADFFSEHGATPPYKMPKGRKFYAHHPSFYYLYGDCTTSPTLQKGYTEITFDQFKKHVMNKPEPITSINVGDVEVSEFELQLNQVLDNIKSILLNKNRKYGDAALNPLKIFSKGSVSNLLDVRIDDKLSRIANRQNDEDEDLEIDLIGYLILKQIQNNK